jgi:hypothetical protein
MDPDDEDQEDEADVPELVARVSSIYVPHTRFVDTLAKIRTAIDTLHDVDDEPPCLYVTGPSRVGKSTLLRKLVADYPKRRDGIVVSHKLLGKLTADHRPLVIVKMPSSPTVISLAQAMLKALGDPNWWRGASRSLLEARVDLLLDLCRVKAVVCDEAQRIVDRSGTVVSFDIVDWLRDRSANNGIILVLVGLGRLAAAFMQDDQFDQRYDAEIRMLPYRWKDEAGKDLVEEIEELRAILISIKQVMPLVFDPEVDVDNRDEFAAMLALRRFYYAGSGLLGRVLKLFKHAARHIVANPEAHGAITLALLFDAFETGFDYRKVGMVNPFAPDWQACLPPPLVDDTLLLPKPKRRRRPGSTPTKAERLRRARDALTKR